jgi:pimeloyl-ACP methyl ester carboxylesterase
VLLLHGIGGGAAIWGASGSGTVAALEAAGYDARAMDLPGYGGAPGTTGIAGFAEAVLRAAGDAPAVLVGHSMGGMVAQEVAAVAPERVAGLVLLCTSAAFGPPGGSWQAQFVAERLAPLEAGIGMAGMAERLVPGLVAPQAGIEPRRIAAEVMSRVPEATYRQALVAIAAFDRREALARIAVPTLVVAAEHDRTAPPEVMRRMADRIPGAAYACLADAGHIANVEQPQAFHAVLLDFLTRRYP